jgi:hypothetical protein
MDVCRVLAIAALLQGWLCVGVLCALQMCCNVRWAVRDFALNVLSHEGERNFVLGLRTTNRYLRWQDISIPSRRYRS